METSGLVAVSFYLHPVECANMTLMRMFLPVIACSLLFAVMGGAIGFGIGKFAPQYYRTVFSHADRSFDPASVGVGLGASQGALGGAIIGLVLVALFSWQETRRARPSTLPAASLSASETPTQPRTPFGFLRGNAARTLRIAVYSLGLILCLFLGLVAGLLFGTSDAYHRQFLQERQAMLTVLADDPAFSKIEIRELSSGGMYLLGDVEPDDMPRLRTLTIQAIGRSRADNALHLFSY